MEQVFEDFRFGKDEEKGYVIRDKIQLAYLAIDGSIKMRTKLIYFHKSPTKYVHVYEVADTIK